MQSKANGRVRRSHSTGTEKLVSALLVLLVAANALWAAATWRTGPILGAGGYCVILLVVLRWKDFRASLVGGGVGALVHLGEQFCWSGWTWRPDSVFLLMNAALAAAVLALSIRVLRSPETGPVDRKDPRP